MKGYRVYNQEMILIGGEDAPYTGYEERRPKP